MCEREVLKTDETVAGFLIICGISLGIMLYFWAVGEMNSGVVVGVPGIVIGLILFGLGLYGRFFPLIVISLLPLLMGSYMLYEGIPLELRERRHRARLKRWEKLDEELEERDRKKREGA